MRLIDADALRKYFEAEYETAEGVQVSMDRYTLKCIDDAPTIDAEPIKHGEWEEKETYVNDGDCEITEWQSARCSKCGKYHTTPYMYSFDNFNFCPNCGAKMKGTEE